MPRSCASAAPISMNSRLQLGEMRKPPAHRAGEVMLREPVRGDHARIPRVAHLGDRVVGRSARPPLENRTRLLLVEQVGDRDSSGS